MAISAERLRGALEAVRLLSAETEQEALLALATRLAGSLMEADRASLYLVDRSTGELCSAVAQGLGAKAIRLKAHQGFAGLAATSGRPVRSADPYADSRFFPGVDEATGYRTRQVLCVPIRSRRGDILGVLELLNRTQGEFSEEDEELLLLLAAQVGVAAGNVQIYEGLRTSLDRLSRLMKVGSAISSELELDALLAVISQATSQMLQAERSTVFVVDPEREELWSRVAEGLEREEIRIPLNAGIAGTVATSGVAVRIQDAYADPRFNPEVDRRTGYQTRNILCVPMRSPRGEVIGVFQVLNKRGGEFTPLDEQLLASLSSQAAVAVENARLYEQVQEAYAKLQALDRMKSDFLNAISHELRTPLSPILGYSEILLSGGMGGLPEGAGRAVQAIAESGRRLLALIESLLAFVRLDQGNVTLAREAVECLPLLTAAAEGFRARAVERQLGLTVEVPEGLPGVLADPQELGMALQHLVDNATKFTPAGGSVGLRASLREGNGGERLVEIAVSDTGIGIPPELQERVFDRFYQVDSSLTRQFGGVGIGLAVVRQIVVAHGSRVELASAPGTGSTFRFALPAA